MKAVDEALRTAAAAAASRRVHLEHAEMVDLLREYTKRGADIVSPSPVSLIGRTRALLARIEAAP
jgi:hypothetical protein